MHMSAPLLYTITLPGGYRAATLALGYVRALHAMNLTRQARYLSSNSGGTWFNAAFTFQSKMPVGQFLGPYVPPKELTADALKQVQRGAQGSFAETITDAGIVLSGLTGELCSAPQSILFGIADID